LLLCPIMPSKPVLQHPPPSVLLRSIDIHCIFYHQCYCAIHLQFILYRITKYMIW
jgi:hypothetical protein